MYFVVIIIEGRSTSCTPTLLYFVVIIIEGGVHDVLRRYNNRGWGYTMYFVVIIIEGGGTRCTSSL